MSLSALEFPNYRMEFNNTYQRLQQKYHILIINRPILPVLAISTFLKSIMHTAPEDNLLQRVQNKTQDSRYITLTDTIEGDGPNIIVV